MTTVNARVHRDHEAGPGRDARRRNAPRLHPVPALPHTVTFGETRQVAVNTPMVTFEGGSYSVPHQLLGPDGVGAGARRRHATSGSSSCTSAAAARSRSPGTGGPSRAARRSTTPTSRTRPAGALQPGTRAGNDAEAEFLALGDGAALWLKEAAAQGTSRIRVKMAHAVSMAKLTNPGRVDWALGHAAVHERFGEGDLASILAANLDPDAPAAWRAGEDRSLTQGTAGWAALGAERQPPLSHQPHTITTTATTMLTTWRTTDDHHHRQGPGRRRPGCRPRRRSRRTWSRCCAGCGCRTPGPPPPT